MPPNSNRKARRAIVGEIPFALGVTLATVAAGALFYHGVRHGAEAVIDYIKDEPDVATQPEDSRGDELNPEHFKGEQLDNLDTLPTTAAEAVGAMVVGLGADYEDLIISAQTRQAVDTASQL